MLMARLAWAEWAVWICNERRTGNWLLARNQKHRSAEKPRESGAFLFQA